MKLNEIRMKKYGLPDTFQGVKMRADDVRGSFEVLRVCLLREDEKGDDGEVLVSPKTGKPYDSWMTVLNIRTEDGKLGLVWTGSTPIRNLFLDCIRTADGRTEPDMVNQYGREVWCVDPPEGKLRFTKTKVPYGKNGTLYDNDDLEEAD